jgi:Domain of unknown function (DUF6946)
MNRLNIATRGIGSWRERLANPELHWKREFSAFETAVSWEFASNSESGLPGSIDKLFRESDYGEPTLVSAVAEHKVDLPGGNAASQSDVWAIVRTSLGMVSLTVEAKAKESFGDEILEGWLVAGETELSTNNRKKRWEYVQAHLPKSDSLLQVRYQILHRCAASVIEAKRLGFRHAAFIVQAFNTPANSFEDYAVFCKALEIPAVRGSMTTTSVRAVSLGIGWADCPLATDAEVVATV